MPWTCPKCTRTISRPNAWHQCVNRPLESVFKNKQPIVYSLFKQLNQQIKKWKGVKASATQNCIVYVAETTFLIIRPMKSALDLKLYLSQPVEEFPVYKVDAWGGRFVHGIRLFDNGDLDDAVLKLLKQSYIEDMARKKP